MSHRKLLITQSLLSAWQYQYTAYDPDSAHQEFLRTLERQKIRPTQARLDGIQFENMVAEYCNGTLPPPDHAWEKGIIGVGDIVRGCQFQVKAYRECIVDGIPFLLYGRLDGLRAGVIYDIKFSHSYGVGKYLNSPQHPMYFACVPEATRFDYVIYTGKDICVESYRREESPDIQDQIRRFISYLEVSGLDKTYCEHWEAL